MTALLACAAALIAEVVVLTLAFDTQPLARVTGSTGLADWPAQLLRLMIVIAFVTVALGGRELRDAWLTRYRAEADPARRLHRFLPIHAAALALFAWVSSVFLAAGISVQESPVLWAAAWVVSAAAVLLAWSQALLPVTRWLEVLTEQRASVACGAAVGSVAWTLGFVSETFWQPMAGFTYQIAERTLRVAYPDTISDAAALTLGTPNFLVHIASACSGYEGIGLVVAFLSVYLFLFRRELRFPSALLLLPLGIVSIWTLNLARIVALIAIGDAGWDQVARGGFHSQAGWIAFNAVGLGFVAAIRKGGWFSIRGRELRRRQLDATSPFLLPFLVVLAAAMVSGALTAGFDWLYPMRLIVLGAVLWTFRRTYASLTWSASWVGLACGLASFAIWMALLPEGKESRVAWPVALESAGSVWAAVWLLARTVGYVVAVPVAEELAFRGYLTRRFWRGDADASQIGVFAWGAFLLSSVIFGAFHGQLWLAGTVAGMLFALALYRRRSMGDAVLAHATTNGLIAAYVFATGDWSAWS